MTYDEVMAQDLSLLGFIAENPVSSWIFLLGLVWIFTTIASLLK